MSKPILISGAGLGGLLLARSLRRFNIPFQIYERDAHVAVRGQGYRIRISSDGINALKSVLTEIEFEAFHSGTAQTGGGGIHSLDAITLEDADMKKPSPDKNLKVAQPEQPEKPEDQRKKESGQTGQGGKASGLGGDVLGVSRGFLRQELLRGFEEKIIWNKNVKGYELHEDGVVVLFSDGSKSQKGSLLVAADGIHSSITRQLTNGKVRGYDTGARMIHGQTHSRAFKELGNGVFFLSDDKTVPGYLRLVTNVRPGSLDEDVELGWVFVGSPGSFDAPNGDFSITGKPAADLVRRLTANWHPKVQAIFQEQNDAEAAFLKMHTSRPEGVPEWQNSPRVTLLGDAVHAMTPAGGVGANTALWDAELLGRLIAESGGSLEGVTERYESEMRPFASANVAMSFNEAAQRFSITKVK